MAPSTLRPDARRHLSRRFASPHSRTTRRTLTVEPLEGRRLLASINGFAAGTPLVGPSEITAGPDGNLWFGQAGGSIGRISLAGEITQFTAGITGSPNIPGIAAGADGNLWFTESTTDRIGRITPQGVVTEFDIVPSNPSPFRNPTQITPGSDGALWFTEPNGNAIGRITTDGVVTEFNLPSGSSTPTDIVSGPDGNLWFTTGGEGSIGVISTQGVFLASYANGITAGAGLTSITNGPNGTLWFTEQTAGLIGQITTAGVVTEFPTGAPTALPTGITFAPDGNLYFTETQGNNVAKISPAGVVTRFPVPTANSQPLGITVGLDRNIWFTESNGVQVDQLVLPTSIMTAGVTAQVAPGRPTTTTFAYFTDLSPAAQAGNFQVTIDFGTDQTGPGTIVTLGPGQFAVTSNFVYGTAGQFTAVITVGTDAGNAAPITSTILVEPSVTVTGSQVNAFAGLPVTATFATFTDLYLDTSATSYTSTISFGDGGTGPGLIRQTGPGQFEVVATHTYTTIGSYITDVTVIDAYGNQSQATGQAVVSSRINVSGTTVAAKAGNPVTAPFATFTDVSPTTTAANFTATVTFGDGGSAPGVIRQTAPGQFEVVATHEYTTIGSYVTATSVIDAFGNQAQANGQAVVSSRFTVVGTALAATAGDPLTATFATFTDPNTTSYQANIDFGDGTSGVGQVQAVGGGQFAVNATHTYVATGVYVATILVADKINTAPPATTNVTVIDPLSTVVINTNDSGRGSLRQAILNANLLPGPNTILFQIPGNGVQTIRPHTQLPPITDVTTVAGASQAAFAGLATATPLIELDGSLLVGQSTGLRFVAGSTLSQVDRLAIYGFHGAQIDLATDGTAVRGSYVGLRADGTIPGTGGTRAVADSSFAGIVVHGFGNVIGGQGVGQGNVISGNPGQGIDFKSGGASGASGFHILTGNLIGLDPTGTQARGNGIHGVLVEAGVDYTMIGPDNVISGNGGNGVELVGASRITIAHVFIGTDISGARAIGNAGAGVCIDLGSNFNQIGSPFDGTPTLISGNGFLGVAIRDGSTGNIITNTRIGTDVSGGVALGNGSTGVLISDAAANRVGPNNVISGNGANRDGAGVWIEGTVSQNNIVDGNLIGTDLSGTRRLGNAVVGVLIVDAPNNLVGGTQTVGTLSRNVISGNGQVGVMISGSGATGNRVEGNLIGTDVTGTGAISNGQILDGQRVGAGVYLNGAPGNTVGGSDAATRNVISGNQAEGIQVFSTSATGNRIQGNFIGTDISGQVGLGNGRDGVSILGAPRTMIDDNLISGNRRNGVVISDPSAVGNVLRRNAIGINASGSALGNGGYGVLFTGNALGRSNTLAADNLIVANGAGQVRSVSEVPAAPPLVSNPNATQAKARAKAKAKAAREAARARTQVQARAKSFGGRALSLSGGKARKPGNV